MRESQKILAIKDTDLFKDLPPHFLFALAEEAEVVELPAKQQIFLKGDPPTGLYIIVSGEVQVIHNNNKVLITLKEKDYFGELALLDNSPRTATVMTQSHVFMLYFDKYLFDNVLNNFPCVMLRIAKSVVGYMQQKIEFSEAR